MLDTSTAAAGIAVHQTRAAGNAGSDKLDELASPTEAVKVPEGGAHADRSLFTSSDTDSIYNWPLDHLDCSAVTLQHVKHSRSQGNTVATNSSQEAWHGSQTMIMGDSAWERLQYKRYMKHERNSSGCSTCNTSFLPHAGDQLFDQVK